MIGFLATPFPVGGILQLVHLNACMINSAPNTVKTHFVYPNGFHQATSITKAPIIFSVKEQLQLILPPFIPL